MAKLKKSSTSVSEEIARNWGWLLGLGVLFVILGCIGVSMAVSLTLLSIMLLGILFVFAGVAQSIDVFKSKQWKGAIHHALIAILYIVGGCLVIYDPVLASAVITALLAWILIVIGITRLWMASTLRHSSGWGWLLFAGIMSIVLGSLILLQWPMSALWLIGLFIAIELMINGWSYIFIAIAIRKKG